MTIQEAIKTAHEDMKAKGFHSPPPSIPALLAMISGELSEALEADRKDKYTVIPEGIYNAMIAGKYSENWFKKNYENYVKDTFEAELADACIRIFDLAGLLGLEIWVPPTKLKEPDLPGNIMEAMSIMGNCYLIYINKLSLTDCLSATLGIIFAIAKKLNIDLWAHIEAAMRFNRPREPKHGKKY